MRKRAFGNTYKILVEKPEGKRPLGRPRRRYENNITADVSDVEGSSLERGARSGCPGPRVSEGGGASTLRCIKYSVHDNLSAQEVRSDNHIKK
jgi:hypothetical protein